LGKSGTNLVNKYRIQNPTYHAIGLGIIFLKMHLLAIHLIGYAKYFNFGDYLDRLLFVPPGLNHKLPSYGY
jgi:hypothetical protein